VFQVQLGQHQAQLSGFTMILDGYLVPIRSGWALRWAGYHQVPVSFFRIRLRAGATMTAISRTSSRVSGGLLADVLALLGGEPNGLPRLRLRVRVLLVLHETHTGWRASAAGWAG
jgi:hypothetical protein